jgi:hypothetical protein
MYSIVSSCINPLFLNTNVLAFNLLASVVIASELLTTAGAVPNPPLTIDVITANDELIDDDTALVPPVPVICTFAESFTGVLPFSTNAGT